MRSSRSTLRLKIQISSVRCWAPMATWPTTQQSASQLNVAWRRAVGRSSAQRGSRAGITCFHVSRPPRGVSDIVAPSWNHVFSRVQATQGGYLTWWSRAGTICFYVSRPLKGGYLTWWPCAGTTCFYVSRPPRGVSNMVVPSWNHVFSRVQATQGGI